MSQEGWIYALATLAGAIGLWLMLPRGRSAGRGLGMLLMAVSLGLFGRLVPQLGDWLKQSEFLVLAAVTVVGALGAVTFRNPVYCAVWFGLSLTGTAGLMLWQGAQFLAVATIVVYAGAILVTLLFVLMLANPAGSAAYDRTTWEAPLAATVGMVVVGVLTITIGKTFHRPGDPEQPSEPAVIAIRDQGPATKEERDTEILNDQHVARLGAELFSRHLIAVELAGTLLLVALVGAVAMVAHSRPHGGSASQGTRPARELRGPGS